MDLKFGAGVTGSPVFRGKSCETSSTPSTQASMNQGLDSSPSESIKSPNLNILFDTQTVEGDVEAIQEPSARRILENTILNSALLGFSSYLLTVHRSDFWVETVAGKLLGVAIGVPAMVLVYRICCAAKGQIAWSKALCGSI